VDLKSGIGSNSGKGLGGPFINPSWGKNTFYLGADGVLTVIDMTVGNSLPMA